jgi:hypothetical protein
VAISDPATAQFTAIKNLENTSIAYKPRHTHTHTHPETLEAREKPRWQLVTQLLTPDDGKSPKVQFVQYQHTIVRILQKLPKQIRMVSQRKNGGAHIIE